MKTIRMVSLSSSVAAGLSVLLLWPEASRAQGSCTQAPAGLVGWWRAEGNANDATGLNNGVAEGGLGYMAGEDGQAFNFNGSDADVRIPASATLDVGVGAGFTVECWINPVEVDTQRPLIEWNDGQGFMGTHFWISVPGLSGGSGSLWANLVDVTDTYHQISTHTGLLVPSQFQHVALTYDKASGLTKIYINGVVAAQANLGSFTPYTTSDLYLGLRPSGVIAGDRFLGDMDEVSLYNRALSDSEIGSIYGAGAAGKCPTTIPPIITLQPVSQTVNVGDSVTFTVAATGSPAPTYQWCFNSSDLAGQTNTSLALASVQLTNAGDYSVLVSNPGGSVPSSTAVLTVSAPQTNCVPLADGLVSWWRGEGNGNDSFGTNNGTVINSVYFEPGLVGQCFHFVSGPDPRVLVPDNPSLQLTNSLTIECWAKYNLGWWLLSRGDDRPGLDAYTFGFIPDGRLGFSISAIDGQSAFVHTPDPIATGIWLHLAATLDGSSGDMGIYINGELVAQTNTTIRPMGPLSGPNPSLSIGNAPGTAGFPFDGWIDEIALYSRALSQDEIQSIYAAGAAGKCAPTPPPACDPLPTGAVGWWQAESNAVDIINGNNGSLNAGAGFAAGEVGAAFNFIGSGSEMRAHASSSLNIGISGGMTAEAWVNPLDASSPQPIIEWNTPGGTIGVNFWLGYPAAGYLTGGFIDTVGSWHLIQTTSSVLRSQVFQHVAITYDKTSGLARLLVNGAVVQTSNLGTFNPQTSYDFTLGHRPGGASLVGQIDEPTLYNRALTTNEIQAIYAAGSNGKCPTVAPVAPFIITQPADQSVTVGQTATFVVQAGGTPPLHYQWSFNGAPITNATASSLVLTNVQMNQAGTYAVQVTNAVNSVTSSNATLSVTFPPATVRVLDTPAAGGAPVTVPVVLVANGNENALGFSLNFQPSLLTYTGLTLGSDAASATLIVNDTTAANGSVGAAVSLPSGTTFNAGTQQVVLVSFVAAAVTHVGTAAISFGDAPILREVSDSQAHALPASYAGGTVTIAAAQFEGDVSPRPNGDNHVGITDWVQVGRFAAGLDTAANGSEFQRADCAPRSTQGNGHITTADWVQAGRYAAGLDPLTVAGGPTSPGPAVVVVAHNGSAKTLSSTVRVAGGSYIAGQPATVSVYLDAQGAENAVGFSVSFDPTVFIYAGATLGSGAGNASLTINALQATSGHIAFLLGLQPGASFSAGAKEIVKMNFTAATSATGATTVALADQPVQREVDDASASVLPANFIDGTMAVNPPPTLTITQSAQNVALLWPIWASNFVLQATADLNPPVTWTNVSGTITINNNQNSLAVPANANPHFYRLKQ
jgi:hypothetical protein